MCPWIVTDFFVIKPTRCTNFTNLFCHETVYVSDSSSVHHQEFIHCKLSNGICHTGTVYTAFEQDQDGNAVPLFQNHSISDFGDMGQSYYSLSGHGCLATSCRSSVKTVRGCQAIYCTEITSFIRGRCEEPPVSPNCCWTHPRGNSTLTAHSGFLYTMSYYVCNAVKTRLPGRRDTSRSA
jgi:hypothetical protein